MMYNSWVNLNHHWQSLLYKEWLLFIKERFPLSTFLWDDSYGLDLLLCKALNLETSKPEDDVQNLNSIIKDELVSLQESTINDVFDMEFLALDSSITYLSPLKDFKKLKVLDFHCTNESCITDFLALENHSLVYVLDYADYQIVDFDRNSNIREFNNIKYIKGYGWPKEMNEVYKYLSHYKID